MMWSRLDIEARRNRLLTAFRGHDPEQRGGLARAARDAGCDIRTARRALVVGWPGLPPLCEVLAAEKVEAAARLRRESLPARLEEAHAAAREDAVEARTKEGKAVRLVQTAAMNSLAALHAERIFDYERALVVMMKDINNPDSAHARAARRAYKDIVEIIAKLVAANESGQRMSRLLLDAPTSIVGGEVGIRPVAPVEISADELQAEVESAARALNELRALNADAGQP